MCKITAVYQPSWNNGREGVERYRDEVEAELSAGGRDEVHIVES